MAVFRAVENRRFLLRSSNTGISMVVDPVGRIVTRLDLYEEGFLLANVRSVVKTAPYTRFGDVPLLAISVVLIAIGGLLGRRAR